MKKSRKKDTQTLYVYAAVASKHAGPVALEVDTAKLLALYHLVLESVTNQSPDRLRELLQCAVCLLQPVN